MPEEFTRSEGWGESVAEPGERPDIELAATERMMFFSDAVVAIAITLLALELPLPTGTTNAELLHSLGEHRDSYLAFVISFLVIGRHWRGHHEMFRYVRRLTGTVQWLNLLWLLMIVATPFATRVITGEGAFFVRFTLYAAVQSIAAVAFLLLVRELDRHDLLLPDTPPLVVRRSYQRGVAVAVSFAASIPVALLGSWAFITWVAVPLLLAWSRNLAERYSSSRPRRP